MSRQNPFVRLVVDVVGGDVVLTMNPPRAHHMAMVIDRVQPREDWLRQAVLSMLVAADQLSISEDFARQTSLALELAEGWTGRHRRERETAVPAPRDEMLQRLFLIGMTVRKSILRQGPMSAPIRRTGDHLTRAVEAVRAVASGTALALAERTAAEATAVTTRGNIFNKGSL